MWMPDVDVPAMTAYVQSMAVFPDETWARAARAISTAFAEHGSPLDAVAALDPPPPTLHLYAQPPAGEYLEAPRGVAAERPWFAVERLEATSHFPVFEVPDIIADRIDRFVRS
jgi:pimeloyl-ACP methyl ester carboxylesterase